MRVKRRTAATLVAAFVIGSLVVSTPSGASGGLEPQQSDRTFSAVDGAVNETSAFDAPKSTSGKLAQSDPALLDRTDSAPVDVIVKLDYDSAASYSGGIDDLAATSPRVTGEPLTGSTAAEQAYATYTDTMDAGSARPSPRRSPTPRSAGASARSTAASPCRCRPTR